MDEPSYDLVSVKKEDGFVATATVALQPTLELGKTQGFEVSCTIPATTDKEVERVIERRRAGFAELVPHKGPAVKGNIVHMDYTGYVNGEPFPGGSATKQAIELGRGAMIPGFEEGIIGHQAGDEFDLNVTFPANYHAKDLAGKEAVFKIKVIDVCIRQLPALNSDFAKKAGKVDTMEEYRAQVHDQLAKRKRTAAVNHARNQILMMLADAAQGELPDILVENAYHAEMQSFQQQLQMQRMSLDKYLGQVHQTRDEFKAAVRKAAERNTRARMGPAPDRRRRGPAPHRRRGGRPAGPAGRDGQKDPGRSQGKDRPAGLPPQRGHPPGRRLGHPALHRQGDPSVKLYFRGNPFLPAAQDRNSFPLISPWGQNLPLNHALGLAASHTLSGKFPCMCPVHPHMSAGRDFFNSRGDAVL